MITAEKWGHILNENRLSWLAQIDSSERGSQQRGQNCLEQILNGAAGPKGSKQELDVKPKCEEYILSCDPAIIVVHDLTPPCNE